MSSYEPTSGRRGFFKKAFAQSAKTVAHTIADKLPVAQRIDRIRPPGAVDELRFLELCTACDDCATACPHGAIFTLDASASPDPGTPVMQPDTVACHMCTDFPCITACETGALAAPTAGAPPKVVLGRASIDKSLCFVFKGPECGACARLCPDGVDALTLRLGRPEINDTCIGCGLCIEACPVGPQKAIRFTPHRPASSEPSTSSA